MLRLKTYKKVTINQPASVLLFARYCEVIKFIKKKEAMKHWSDIYRYPVSYSHYNFKVEFKTEGSKQFELTAQGNLKGEYEGDLNKPSICREVNEAQENKTPEIKPEVKPEVPKQQTQQGGDYTYKLNKYQYKKNKKELEKGILELN